MAPLQRIAVIKILSSIAEILLQQMGQNGHEQLVTKRPGMAVVYLYGPPRVCKKKIIVCMKEKLQSYIRPLD